MFDQSHIVALLAQYKYIFLFPLVVVEGPLATILAGSLVAIGALNGWLTILIVIIADLIGDSIYYAIGRWGRDNFFDRWGHYLGITPERIVKIENHFKNDSGRTLIIGKISHAVGGIVLVAAGMVRMSYWRFIVFNFIATIPKALILLMLGFYFGLAYVSLSRYLNNIALIAVLAAAAAWAVYVIYKKINIKL
jgi:membrane protein DedA with SNARE-associated domain